MQVRKFFKLNGETFKIISGNNGEILKRVNGVWTNSTAASFEYDSLHFDKTKGILYGYKAGFTTVGDTLDGRYALITSLTDSIAAMRVELGDSLTTARTVIADSVVVLRNDLATKTELNAVQNVFTINLPSSGTVAGRCVTPTELPAGWTVAADGVTPTNLVITHGLARHIAYVTVFTISGVTERQLFGNAAYAGIYAPTTSILKIESLATITSSIRINLIFK
jgi:hypothetical protein